MPKQTYRVRRGVEHATPGGVLRYPDTLELTEAQAKELEGKVSLLTDGVEVVTDDRTLEVEQALVKIRDLEAKLAAVTAAKDKAEADVTRLNADLSQVPDNAKGWVAEKANLQAQLLEAQNELADLKDKVADSATLTALDGVGPRSVAAFQKHLGVSPQK